MEKQEEINIQNLLNQVGAIKEKYNQIAEITGEKFNVFSILGLQDSEVRLHSNLINELLNPRGKHGQKDLFLKIFIDVTNSKITNEIFIENAKNISSQKIKDFKTETAKSAVEIHTGFKNEDATEGGRIDILIDDNNKYGIIIENKIWAVDQEKQLYRYHNYGEKTYKNFHLIYLTIDKKEPSQLATDGKLTKEQYLCLSYNEDIINWLELCRKECTQLPIIRETITQYINQIKNYSGKSINHMENMEISELLSKKENLENSFLISSSLQKTKQILLKELQDDLEAFAKKEGFFTQFDFEFSSGSKWKVLKFYKEDWKEKNVSIDFSFESDGFKDMLYGVRKIYREKEMPEEIYQFLNTFGFDNFQHSQEWPIHKYFNPQNWNENNKVWIEIKDGNTLKKFIIVIETLSDIIHKYLK